MGQRLNLEIANEGKVLANAYYHWSGYTESALAIAKQAVSYLTEDTSANPLTLAVQALISTGASLTEDEYKALASMDTGGRIFIRSAQVHRNDGLISVTSKGIKETKDWQEQGVQIDMDKRLVHTHQAFWSIEDKEYEEEYERKVADLPELSIDLDGISFEDFEDFMELVKQNHEWYDKSEGRVYMFVE